MNDNRISVNGLKIYPFTSTEELINFAEKEKAILVAVNSKKIKHANPEIRDIVNRNVGYVDGAGAQIALRHKGVRNVLKIPGCELWLKIIAAHPSATFYLIGSTDEVIEATVDKLRKDFPAINIAGYRNGFFKDDAEKAQLLDVIAEKKPDYVFVAMGSPRQEYLMEEMLNVHKAVYQGLGGSFDLYVGHFKRAPKLLQRINCEWLWRFIAQPARITRIGPYVRFALRLYTNRL